MNNIIREFYVDNGIPAALLSQKMRKFDENSDIALEFEYWIKNRKYKKENPVTVEGYTAEKLAQLSDYLNGEGSFALLIELREKPQAALSKIQKGFKMK